MLEHLFGSKTRVNILRTFFRQPDKAFYVRELTRLLEVQINAIRRELELLTKLGLVGTVDAPKDEAGGSGSKRKKYYSVNAESVLYSELHALLIKAQLLDEQELVRELIDKSGEIDLFLLTGRFTGDKRAPVEIFLVGELKERSVARLVKKYEKKFGFEIRYTTMSKKEFFERRHMMDKFVYSIFEANVMKVVDRLGV